jgi:hypothetical protein
MCRIASLFLLQRQKISMSRTARNFNSLETRALIKFFFLQCKTPKEIHTFLDHAPCTMHHAPCTMYHARRTTHHAPCTMYHAPCTTHHAPCTMYHRMPTSKIGWPSLNFVFLFSTCDAPRPRRPKTVTTPEIIDQIHELILKDHRISSKSIAEQLGISRERIGSIIH